MTTKDGDFDRVGVGSMDWMDVFQSSPARFDLPPINPSSPSYTDALNDMFAISAPMSGRVVMRIDLPFSPAGCTMRLRLSNEDGQEALLVERASVGHGSNDPSYPLSFDGEKRIRIAPGAPVVTDPIAVDAKSDDESIQVQLDLIGYSVPPTGIERGAMAMTMTVDGQSRDIKGRPVVSGVQLLTKTPYSSIIAFGDSFNDLHGASEPTWIDGLARRLSSRRVTMLSAGIAGNRLITDGWGRNMLGRLERDVLRIKGASHVFLSGGLNDIGMAGSSPLFMPEPQIDVRDLIAAYAQIGARVRSAGLRFIVSTLSPFAGAFFFTPEKEEQRQTINAWIRSSQTHDAVLDVDAIVRDPANVMALNPAFDSGDHLHPNGAGHEAIAAAVGPSILGQRVST